eukprot:TCALIF_10954-PA protein Name:"Protein of unknown function" AED:0.90 eAED:0.90 QI:0/0/0.16/0.16/1/1/6/0/170
MYKSVVLLELKREDLIRVLVEESQNDENQRDRTLHIAASDLERDHWHQTRARQVGKRCWMEESQSGDDDSNEEGTAQMDECPDSSSTPREKSVVLLELKREDLIRVLVEESQNDENQRDRTLHIAASDLVMLSANNQMGSMAKRYLVVGVIMAYLMVLAQDARGDANGSY